MKILILLLTLLFSIVRSQEITMNYTNYDYETTNPSQGYLFADKKSTVTFNYNNDNIIKVIFNNVTTFYVIVDDGEILTIDNIEYIKYFIKDEDDNVYKFFIAIKPSNGCILKSKIDLIKFY